MTPPPRRLFLFDIDGTLLQSGGAGEKALRLGIRDRFGLEEDLAGIEIAGRTDSGIARQFLAKHGLPASAENLEGFFEAYLNRLGQLLPHSSGRLLPGIRPLLEALHGQPDAALGLLTGNLARGAELKLTQYGIWHFFPFGAYADDHHDRNQLGHFARRRAFQHHGVDFQPQAIFVLGDTPHDITCARAIGARAVAIATGRYSRHELARCAPDLLFDDLSDLEGVLGALMDGPGRRAAAP